MRTQSDAGVASGGACAARPARLWTDIRLGDEGPLSLEQQLVRVIGTGIRTLYICGCIVRISKSPSNAKRTIIDQGFGALEAAHIIPYRGAYEKVPCSVQASKSCLGRGGKNIRPTQPIRARFPAANNAEIMGFLLSVSRTLTVETIFPALTTRPLPEALISS